MTPQPPKYRLLNPPPPYQPSLVYDADLLGLLKVDLAFLALLGDLISRPVNAANCVLRISYLFICSWREWNAGSGENIYVWLTLEFNPNLTL